MPQRAVIEPLGDRTHVNTPVSPGLTVAFFATTPGGAIDMDAQPFNSAVASNITLNQATLAGPNGEALNVFHVRWSGWINVTQDDTYYFRLPNADANSARLRIANRPPAKHGCRTS